MVYARQVNIFRTFDVMSSLNSGAARRQPCAAKALRRSAETDQSKRSFTFELQPPLKQPSCTRPPAGLCPPTPPPDYLLHWEWPRAFAYDLSTIFRISLQPFPTSTLHHHAPFLAAGSLLAAGSMGVLRVRTRVRREVDSFAHS